MRRKKTTKEDKSSCSFEVKLKSKEILTLNWKKYWSSGVNTQQWANGSSEKKNQDYISSTVLVLNSIFHLQYIPIHVWYV